MPILKFSTFDRPMKCTPPWSKLYQARLLAVVVEVLQVAGQAVVERVVFARHGVHAIDADFLQQFLRLAELLRFRQVADIAGVHDQRGRLRQRIDVRAARRRLPTTSGLASLWKPICVSLIWTKVNARARPRRLRA